MLQGHHHCGYGLAVLLCALFLLSLFAGINYEQQSQVYESGTIADADVVAQRKLSVEDTFATRMRREQMRKTQPLVFDLNPQAFDVFNTNIVNLLHEINGLSYGDEAVAMRKLEEDITPEMAEEILEQLARSQVQNYILAHLLPNVHALLSRGIAKDRWVAHVGEGGVILRNINDEDEILRPDVQNLPDVQSTIMQLSSVIRKDSALDPPASRALILLLSAYLPASLTYNEKLTNERAEAVVAHVDPVYYVVQRGEMVVRKGDLVTREQQAKLQAIYNSVDTWIHFRFSLGLFLLSTIISLGLFMAPSGKPGTPLRRKDYHFMALLLVSCSLIAKAVYVFGTNTGEAQTIQSLAYAFPVAGVVGLVALVFAARRYCTMSLLLALFTTVMFKGDMALFFYYFLGGMLTTLLVTRAQSRQDMVWGILPLSAGQMLFWLAMALFSETPLEYWPWQLLAVVLNSSISLLMLFAFSPVLELVFSYTTRFRLMEFMSLEHPLMQEMMVQMPGTYHHSLIVANMVEAGAKAIGANSLLCKVSALYHDVGKLSHPDYFIENQYGGRNKHDKLAPSMSALILTAHVKQGAELAKEYKLGDEIQDIILQHHGKRVIRFFYHKAVTNGENVSEDDFRYGGPRPQSKEAAILMLADSVEASSRTLSDPTSARLKTHIDTIIKGIFAEGELDESTLTFKDLHALSEQFLRILTGIFHQRISYPAGNAAPVVPASTSPAVPPMQFKDDIKDRPLHAQEKIESENATLTDLAGRQ